MRNRFGAASRRALVVLGVGAIPCSYCTACSGGDPFVAQPAPRAVGTISLNATVTSIDCPRITSYTISPVQNAAGSDIAVTSTTDVSLGVRPVYRWTASSGSFMNPDHADTTYRCGNETNPTLTLTVTYGSCLDRIAIGELDCT